MILDTEIGATGTMIEDRFRCHHHAEIILSTPSVGVVLNAMRSRRAEWASGSTSPVNSRRLVTESVATLMVSSILIAKILGVGQLAIISAGWMGTTPVGPTGHNC
jgi:hypothetical protein